MKAIITGTTGMVGKGVLLECIERPEVNSILVINRKPLGIIHPKLKEVIHSDFQNFTSIKEELKGYDACFHCMGVSSAGKKEEDFSKLTYNITSQLVDALFEVNQNMVFNYISGAGTDSSEKGGVMWARVKGKTENYILNKGFKDAYMFRAGAILPEKGIKSGTPLYNFLYVILKPFFPFMRKMKNITTTTKFGNAMVNTVLFPIELKKLENTDINLLASKSN
jgi:nucleoside-diphosphate-sugar epimerase